MLSELYGDLQDNIIDIIDGVAKRNPMLYAPLYTAMLQLADSYKLGSVPYKLINAITKNVKDFKVKNEFKSEALKKVIYSVVETCDDIFNDFMVIKS